jgi:hypothetical protein
MNTQLLISALLALIEYAQPRIQEAVEDGDVSAEDQAKLKERIDGFRNGLGFDSPEWTSRANPKPEDPPQGKRI